MAKRLTDSDKWKDAWYRKLPPVTKLFWLYLCDECDCAGVWKVDLELASFHIGATINAEESLATFGERVSVIPGGERWFIRKFVVFQYGPEFKPTSTVHQGVMKILSRLSLPWSIASPPQPHGKGSHTSKEREKDPDSARESAEREADEQRFRSLLVGLVVADGGQAIRKWWALAKMAKGARDIDERCAAVRWCVEEARRQGIKVQYASDAQPFMAQWRPRRPA
jgi:hypothetical protein